MTSETEEAVARVEATCRDSLQVQPPHADVIDATSRIGMAIVDSAMITADARGDLWVKGRVDDLRTILTALASERRYAERRYAEMGRACEANGLAWFTDDGLRFQPPADVIAEQAAASEREARERAERERDDLRKRFIEPFATIIAAVPQPWRDVITRFSVAEKNADARAQSAEAALERAERERDEALREMGRYAAEAGEAKGRLEMSEAAGIVDMWREHAQSAEAALAAIMAVADDDFRTAYTRGWRDREEAFVVDAARVLPQPPGDAG